MKKRGLIGRVGRAFRALFRSEEFKAASVSRLFSDWITASSPSPDQIVRGNLRILRARSRDLARNNAHVRQYLNLVAVNVIGPNGFGLDVASRLPNGELDEEANEIIEDGWSEWSDGPVTIDGRFDLVALQRLLIRAVARDGEVFVRIWRGPYGMKLEPMDADLLDETYNVRAGSDGNRNEIRMGIEIDAMARPVAYHFWNSIEMEMRRERVRIAADEVIHLFDPERVHQTRGLPWAVPVMDLLKMLDGYVEAELVAARAGAAKMGFFTRKEGSPAEMPTDEQQEMEANPGTIDFAPEGYDFQEWDPDHPTTAFPEFTASILRAVASGLGVSYPSLTGDLASVNYSSMRSGLLIERDLWRTLHRWWIGVFCRRVFVEWLDMAMLTGAINLGTMDSRPYRYAKYTPRGWVWVDPLKDVQATIAAIKHGLASRTSALREQGFDVREMFEELRQESELADAVGIEIVEASDSAVPAMGDGEDGPENGNGRSRPRVNRLEPWR